MNWLDKVQHSSGITRFLHFWFFFAGCAQIEHEINQQQKQQKSNKTNRAIGRANTKCVRSSDVCEWMFTISECRKKVWCWDVFFPLLSFSLFAEEMNTSMIFNEAWKQLQQL